MNDESASAGQARQVQWDPSKHLPQRRPGWPTAVGIVFTIYASLGLIGGILGMIMLKLSASSNLWQLDGEPLPPSMAFGPLAVALGALGILLSIFLLYSSLMLLARRKNARGLFITYGIMLLLFAALRVAYGIHMIAEMRRWSRENPDSMFAQGFDPMSNNIQSFAQTAGIVIGFVFTFSIALFVLIWFGKVKTKPEHYTGKSV